jgi:hypothetical protein
MKRRETEAKRLVRKLFYVPTRGRNTSSRADTLEVGRRAKSRELYPEWFLTLSLSGWPFPHDPRIKPAEWETNC